MFGTSATVENAPSVRVALGDKFSLILRNRPRTRTRIAGGFGSGTQGNYLAFGGSTSQLELVQGFEDEFEFEDD
jgi:hypothetical protein